MPQPQPQQQQKPSKIRFKIEVPQEYADAKDFPTDLDALDKDTSPFDLSDFIGKEVQFLLFPPANHNWTEAQIHEFTGRYIRVIERRTGRPIHVADSDSSATEEDHEAKIAKMIERSQGRLRDFPKRCEVCFTTIGKLMRCAKCCCTYYCSREHQVEHWRNGGHKKQCAEYVAKFTVRCSICEQTFNSVTTTVTALNSASTLVCKSCLATNFKKIPTNDWRKSVLMPTTEKAREVVPLAKAENPHTPQAERRHRAMLEKMQQDAMETMAAERFDLSANRSHQVPVVAVAAAAAAQRR
jgi:hypothetical protein